MRIDIITIFPEMLESPFNHSIIQRAKNKGLIEIQIHNLREYSTNKQRKVDDYAFGGGAGMVMMIEPFDRCLGALKAKNEYEEVIYLCPDGELLDQKIANNLSLKNNIVLLCGHYKGIDQRIRDFLVTKEISIGNYVLSGGELAASVLVDSIVRLIPGVLTDSTSALTDSFQNDLLDAPIYTRPANYKNWKVPDILISGHEAKIAEWRNEQAILKTKKRRPDLLS